MCNRYNLSESKCRIFNGSKPLSSSTQQRERVNATNQNTQSFMNRPETDMWTLVGFDDDVAFSSLERIHKILVSELKYEEEGSMLPPQPRNMAVSKTFSVTSNSKKRKRYGPSDEIVMSTIGRRIEKEFGTDITQLNLKSPEDVSTLHQIIGDELNLPHKRQATFFANVLAQKPNTKPNVIFDVTLKDLRKLIDNKKSNFIRTDYYL